jgi:hypothetical protein
LGLLPPELEVLAPTHQSYRALLLQPSGPIYADEQRIGHWHGGDGAARCKSFLTLAAARGNQLVVAPEYCMPIDTLEECVVGDVFPGERAIWVLGCESLTPAAVEQFKQNAAGHCTVIHEPIEGAAVQGTYYDAVAYCFVTKDLQGNRRRVVILQFKTGPSRDPHFLENEHLKVGSVIYQFRNADNLFGFSAIICSDAFTLRDRDLCRTLTDRAILVHIQLNPNPRHVDYREYRADTFSRPLTFSNCDIVCLNWAQKVAQYDKDGGPVPWPNIGGSAWYLPGDRCSTEDQEILRNDARGLYYSFLEKRRHVLLFHYDEAVFELTVPKIAILGAAVQGNTIGPVANTRFVWNPDTGSWIQDDEVPDAGLTNLLQQNPLVAAAFAPLVAGGNRLSIERAVALSCGQTELNESWHVVGKLEACQMKADEVVYRTTFCMDPCIEARTARHDRVQRVAALHHILLHETLPIQVRDVGGGGATITWARATPHVNVVKQGCLPALVAYLGLQPLPDRVRGIADGYLEMLRRENKAYQKRVAVCYRKADGTMEFAEMPALTRIDHDGGSLTNITTVL